MSLDIDRCPLGAKLSWLRTTGLDASSPIDFVCVCVCVCVLRHLRSLSKFQVYNTVLLTVVTMLYPKSPELTDPA